MGAWQFMDRRTERLLSGLAFRAGRLRYVGRHAAASPATGLAKVHAAEQADLVARALDVA
jgi:2-oxoglutarate dehydrogenase E1 component